MIENRAVGLCKGEGYKNPIKSKPNLSFFKLCESYCHNPNPQRRPSLEIELKWVKIEGHMDQNVYIFN